ncbi:MAG: NTP transferase domain-containing protein [Spirochaetaceae bacterium]|nr:NTP transferase domain-containing protein [Spirochaetaceae bacterium]
MNYIKRAIIMAAGIGSRLQPLTHITPKPLIQVDGIKMIDSIVSALHENNIHEIIVVIGHLKEQFYEWAKDKPDIRLIENPYYKTANNISSLFVARDFIDDVIILDGDQIIYNKNILHQNFDHSGYSVCWTETDTNEWILTVNENMRVTSYSRRGGKQGWQLFSISRWTKSDGLKLARLIEKEFIEHKQTDIYWDDVPLSHLNIFDLTVYPIKVNDIIEVDTIDELKKLETKL